MFKHFFKTEIKTALKQPMVYIFFLVVSLLAIFLTVNSNVNSVGANLFRNSPAFIVSLTLNLTIMLGTLIATAFFNNAALRDHLNGFNEILFSTPIKKSGYFFGRFFGALFLSTLPLLGVFFGVFLGTILAPIFGWQEADRFGPFFLENIMNSYFLIILPNLFFVGALIFILANRWKSTVISFIGSFSIVILYSISGGFMSDLENETLAALLDSFGSRTYGFSTKYFTAVEKNTIPFQLSSVFLWNRLLWFCLGLVVLLTSYFSFSFQIKNQKAKKEKKNKALEKASFKLPDLHPNFSFLASVQQFISFFKISFLSILKSITFKILLFFCFVLVVVGLYHGFEYYGLQSYPVTYKVVDIISGQTGLFILIISIFFSGELVWRDRENKINEVIGASSHSSFSALLAKVLSLVSVVSILYITMALVGVFAQLAKGYTTIEYSLYFENFIYDQLSTYFIWACVFVFIQVLLNHKYLAYFVSILILLGLEVAFTAFDIQSRMLYLAAGPSIFYSDMNGFGPGFTGKMWFNLYWVLFGFLAFCKAVAFLSRGTEKGFLEKVKGLFKNTSKGLRTAFVLASILWLGVASYLYYNTQILNSYKTPDENELIQVEYEKKYKKYENVKLPMIKTAKYEIDIFPYQRDVFVKASLKLKNESGEPIDSIHFNTVDDWKPEFTIPNAKLVLDDKKLGYVIYELENSLEPNQELAIEIKTKYVTKGFENTEGNVRIVENGTFLDNTAIIPTLGYSSHAELSDKLKRKKYDLPERSRMPKLNPEDSVARSVAYFPKNHSDYIEVETIISTAKDQIAVAPGSLKKQWTKEGRNYFHYKIDQPSLNFYSFVSAKYEVARRKWNGIDLEVYYDKKHSVNIPKFLDILEESLDYYTNNFGPYFHKQCRILEIPRYHGFAQAFAGTMPYSEAMGFITNFENDTTKGSMVDAVVAHEMGHQWWGHQVTGAGMQGSTFLSEAFAEYSSLMVMKNKYNDPMKIKNFLKYDYDAYLRMRTGEEEQEMPLYKVEDQPYIHYKKGSVVLYALQDYIGEDKMNTALRGFLEEFRYKTPYPTSLDFIRHLEPQVPDSLQYLITDWIKEVTLYDNRLKKATYKKLPSGKYEVNMEVESHKIKVDSLGVEHIGDINDWVDIGVLSEDKEHLLYVDRVKIDQANMTFSFEMDSVPARAVIDPKMLLIDRVLSDNEKKISEE